MGSENLAPIDRRYLNIST